MIKVTTIEDKSNVTVQGENYVKISTEFGWTIKSLFDTFKEIDEHLFGLCLVSLEFILSTMMNAEDTKGGEKLN